MLLTALAGKLPKTIPIIVLNPFESYWQTAISWIQQTPGTYPWQFALWTDTSQLETSWNPVDLRWIMLHPLCASETRARESTGKGRLGFRCRAVISYSFINISLACFIRSGDFTSPQPKPQEDLRQVKATSTKQLHGREIQVQNSADGQHQTL